MGLTKRLQCAVVGLCLASISLILWYQTFRLGGQDSFCTSFLTGVLAVVCTMLVAAAADIFKMSPAESHSLKSLVLQYLFQRLITVLGLYHRRNFEAGTKDLARTQEDILINNFIRPNADTEFGRKYDFKSINSREDFRRRVPLTTYEDYAEYIERIQTNGADRKGVLTDDTVVYLAVTSGSTGRNKVIPVGKKIKHKSIRLYSVIMDVMRQASGGWQLSRQARLGYKPAISHSPSGLPMGPISYHMHKHMPFTIIPREVYDIEDEQTALYVEAVVMLGERELGYLHGFMSTLVWAFWRVIEQNWRQICTDIERGVISSSIALEPHIRLAVEKHLMADARRAEELREQFQHGTVGIFQRVWPRLRVLHMFTTGGFKHYAKLLVKNPCHGVYVFSSHYGASEGIFGLQINQDMHVSCLDAQYAAFTMLPQEYIPITDDKHGEADTVFVEQLKVGHSYEVVSTSPMGLYRYRMGDVIKVVGFHHQCPVYEFQYRTGHVLNVYWEKTPENVVYEAVHSSLTHLNLSLIDYTTTEDVALHCHQEYQPNSDCRHYILFLEVNRENGSPASLSKDDKALIDTNLRSRMELYNTLRHTGSIGPMHVIEVMPGTFRALRTHMLGRINSVQLKMPRVIRKPELLSLILSARHKENGG